LVWFEQFEKIAAAMEREKQIKAGNRKMKERLINDRNKKWNDLWEEIQWWWQSLDCVVPPQ
jgi:putative endonuclease